MFGIMIPVDSTAIRAVGYDLWSATLVVEFRNGRTYDHPDVPVGVFIGLLRADSKGGYYNQCIRGRY